MSEEEYWETNKQYESDDEDLPSTFLSEEDLPGDTNVIIIPNYKFNLELILGNYIEMIVKAKTKKDLQNILEDIWDQAEKHGRLVEKLDKLQYDIEMLQFDLLNDQGEFGIIEDDEE